MIFNPKDNQTNPMQSPKGEGYRTPNPVIGGNNYNESSNLSSKNNTNSFQFGKNRSVTKLKSETMLITKSRRPDRSNGSRRSNLSSSYIKKNKQKYVTL
jgi:hypothetical protein